MVPTSQLPLAPAPWPTLESTPRPTPEHTLGSTLGPTLGTIPGSTPGPGPTLGSIPPSPFILDPSLPPRPYKMLRGSNSVFQLWTKWTLGLAGGLSIEALDCC